MGLIRLYPKGTALGTLPHYTLALFVSLTWLMLTFLKRDSMWLGSGPIQTQHSWDQRGLELNAEWSPVLPWMSSSPTLGALVPALHLP